MSAQKERRKLGIVVPITLILIMVVLPMLYFASIGPLVHVVEGSVDAESPLVGIVSIYFIPAGLLMETGYGGWLESYINWWD